MDNLPIDIIKIIMGYMSPYCYESKKIDIIVENLKLSDIEKSELKDTIYNQEITELITPIAKHYLCYGVLHSIFDKPAIVHNNGKQEWYDRGLLHRIGKPAIIYKDGEEWYTTSMRRTCDQKNKYGIITARYIEKTGLDIFFVSFHMAHET